MKKIQKILAVILSLVFIVSAFAGCTEKHKESKLSTLTHDKLPQYEGDDKAVCETPPSAPRE